MSGSEDEKLSVFFYAENTDVIGFRLVIVEFSFVTGKLLGIKGRVRIHNLKFVLTVHNRSVASPKKRVAETVFGAVTYHLVSHNEGSLLTADYIGLSVRINAHKAFHSRRCGAIQSFFFPSGKIFIVFPLVVSHKSESSHF